MPISDAIKMGLIVNVFWVLVALFLNHRWFRYSLKLNDEWADFYEDMYQSMKEYYTKGEGNYKQPCGDTISRQAVIDAILAMTGNSSVRELYEHVQEHGLSEMWSGGVSAVIDTIIAVPSAQPQRTDEWCTDCAEYDHEKHCCPRWNSVIRNTVEELYNLKGDENNEQSTR